MLHVAEAPTRQVGLQTESRPLEAAKRGDNAQSLTARSNAREKSGKRIFFPEAGLFDAFHKV